MICTNPSLWIFMARMGCSETAAHVLGRGMCHRADTERALCATVRGDSRAVIGKRDDKTRGDCLGACVCVCMGPAPLASGCSPCCSETIARNPKRKGTSVQLLKLFCFFFCLVQLGARYAISNLCFCSSLPQSSFLQTLELLMWLRG